MTKLVFIAVILLACVGIGAWAVMPLLTKAKTETAVAKIETKAAEATTEAHDVVAKAETKTVREVTVIHERTERAAAVAAVPAAPDRTFWDGVCGSALYVGANQCRGFGGQP